MILKVKEDVDLKELERFGYESLILCYFKTPIFFKDDWIVRIDKQTREIIYWNVENGAKGNVEPHIQDLIQAGLVEKVGEK